MNTGLLAFLITLILCVILWVWRANRKLPCAICKEVVRPHCWIQDEDLGPHFVPVCAKCVGAGWGY